MSSFWDYLSSTALSLTVSGNTGISPFLTLLLLGVMEVSDPSLLNMGETMEVILASWYSIAILSLLTTGELIGKCIPAVDEVIDSIMIFVVPVLSILGTLGTVGVFDSVLTSSGKEEEEVMINNNGSASMDDNGRMLGDVGESFLTAWKVILVLFGIGLSLLIHFFKMIIRISGIVCCLGCCQPCITILEITTVCWGVLLAVFIRPIAILLCIIFVGAAIYTIKVKYCDKKEEKDGNEQTNNNSNTTNNNEDSPQPKVPVSVTPPNSSNQYNNTTLIENTVSNHDNSGDADPENPPPSILTPTAPSAFTTTEEVVSIEDITPIPPPPANNPNYTPDIDVGMELPMAIAVPITTNTNDELPVDNPNRNNIRNGTSSGDEKVKQKGNEAVVY